jgi:hypothetical protein
LAATLLEVWDRSSVIGPAVTLAVPKESVCPRKHEVACSEKQHEGIVRLEPVGEANVEALAFMLRLE